VGGVNCGAATEEAELHFTQTFDFGSQLKANRRLRQPNLFMKTQVYCYFIILGIKFEHHGNSSTF
jgi:hypothetical protein